MLFVPDNFVLFLAFFCTIHPPPLSPSSLFARGGEEMKILEISAKKSNAWAEKKLYFSKILSTFSSTAPMFNLHVEYLQRSSATEKNSPPMFILLFKTAADGVNFKREF